MSTLRNPVGPQPPSVYWRRRLLVLLGVLALIVIIALIVMRPGSGSSTPNPSSSHTSSPSDEPSTDPSDEPVADPSKACDPSVILLEPVTDADSYPAGQQPMLSMTITNTGAAPCTIDVGTGAQYYAIVSGSDPIWNSRDCQTGPTQTPMVLEPNKAVPTTPFPWDRTRSSPSTCSSERPEVTGGGATYRLSVKLGEIASEGDAPFLLY